MLLLPRVCITSWHFLVYGVVRLSGSFDSQADLVRFLCCHFWGDIIHQPLTRTVTSIGLSTI